MSDLTSGRSEPCKDFQGGLRKVWLYNHIKYPIQVLQGLKSGLLTSHPITNIFEYQSRLQSMNQSEIGGGYRVTGKLVLPVLGVATNALVLDLIKTRLGLIGEDHNGRFWVYGIENGLDAEARLVTGQEREGLNGYEITFSGIEKYSAPFVSSLAITGFRTQDNPIILDCLYSSSGLPSSIGYKVSDCNVPQST